jgi:AcrR family transcriptional regulator
MEQIAEATGMGKSSIYYYFPGKEEIFKAVVLKEAQELKRRLDQTIAADKSPVERLRAYILFRLNHVRTLGNFYAALNEESLQQMDFILKIRRKFEEDELKQVQGILEEGMAEGAFQLSSSRIGALAISTMMKGLELPLLLNESYKTDRRELLDDLIRVLLYGIVKR